MTESAKETQKINKEQNDSLQAQLKTITEANRKQGEDLTKKIGEMQGSITSLTEKNAQINREAWTEGRMILTEEQTALLKSQVDAFIDFI